MPERIWNFNAGPATLPLPVLEKIKADLPNYNNTGMAVMELSHRAKDYAAIHAEAQNLLRELLTIPANYKILFLQGGASTQFFMIPMNLLSQDQTADYINTGTWSKKAIKEAKLFGKVNVAATSEDANFTYIPAMDGITLTPGARYLHCTSNNTIAGTQMHVFPDSGTVPLICDMSSDILSRKLDVSKFGLIYAGAQKNLGPSGVTVVIIRDDVIDMSKDTIPSMCQYKIQAEQDSLYNTAPTFSIYILREVLKYFKTIGGMKAVEKENAAKGKLLYSVIDDNADFFRSPIARDSRSLMNVVFRLPSEDLEKQFIADASAAGFGGLKGHRSVGGIRVSMYNAMTLKGIEALTEFMLGFMKDNG
ncbi:3-phosphoserine/phosphohydroxythreonine transaminase [bacterium]|nr:3-phosphoserine/phosphohydroxythreonine transaminase [bacterium]